MSWAESSGIFNGIEDYSTKMTESTSHSLVAQSVKNLPTTQDTWAQFPGWKDPLEKEMATHNSILSWRIPWNRGTWKATVHGVAKYQT